MTGTRPGRVGLTGIVAGLTIALTVAPVWGAPLLVTQDGPSHVYNAALATWVDAGREPFAAIFGFDPGVRPNAATHVLLASLGPHFGWELSERLVLTLALVGILVTAFLLARPPAPLFPLLGAVASSWFVWMGFYDFALSIPLYIALLLLLPGPLSVARHGVVQLTFGLLYLTHFFTFAIAIALVASMVAWDAQTGHSSWRRMGIVLPAAALLGVELATGGLGGGPMLWTEGIGRLTGFATGDFVVTVLGLDTIAGVTLAAGAVAVAVLRLHAARHGRKQPLSAAAAFGLALIALSLVAPDTLGEGGYVPVRLRFLGTLALLPSLSDLARSLRPRILAAIGALLLGTLAIRTDWLVSDARGMRDEHIKLDALLERSGAREGAWVVNRLTVYRRWPFRIGAYRHLAERVATQRSLVVLNNYEALNGVFSVMWRDRPDWVVFRPEGDHLAASLVPGAIRWSGQLYVIHESDRQVTVGDPHLGVGATLASGRLAVTTLWRRD